VIARVGCVALVAGLALPRAVHARGCHETSDVVGYHHCSWFGVDWSRDADTPRLSFDIDYYFRHFEADPFSLGSAPLVATGGPTDFHATSSGEAWRVLVGFGHFVYTGVEIDGGSLDRVPRTVGTPVVEGLELAPYALAGVHLYERYRIAVSTELAAGFRYDDFEACNTSDCPDVSQWKPDVQARVRADVFIHPHVSLGIGYGESVIDSNERIFMVGISLHGRAMDGMY